MGCREHRTAGGHLQAPGHRELGIPAPTVLATQRAMQAKDVFSLHELSRYFCLVEIIENFRKEKYAVFFFLNKSTLFNCGIFVSSKHYKEEKNHP